MLLCDANIDTVNIRISAFKTVAKVTNPIWFEKAIHDYYNKVTATLFSKNPVLMLCLPIKNF